MAVLIFLLSVLTIVWAVGSLVQLDNFLYYQKTYNSLTSEKLVFDYYYGGHYYFCEPSDKGNYQNEIVVFVDNLGNLQDVEIGPRKYIHGGMLSCISPYTLYWWFKYKDWFEKNKEKFDSSN